MTRNTAKSDHKSVDLLLEVVPQHESGDLASSYALPENFRRRAAEIAASIGEVADEFRTRLGQTFGRLPNSDWGVDSIEIKFDINIQAGAGVLIAKASSGATFSARITMKASKESR